MSKLRSIARVRFDAGNSSLRKRAKEMIEREAKIHEVRSWLATPTQRIRAVEWYFEKPLAEITGDDRLFAEAVAITHKDYELARFSEVNLEGCFHRLGLGELIREYNQRLIAELEKEIEAVTEYLTPLFRIHGCESEVETSGPIRAMRRELTGILNAAPVPLGYSVESLCRRFLNEPSE